MDKIFSPIKERVFIYVENKMISKDSFYSSTGISASNFKGKGAKSELGGDKIAKILTLYDDINPDWLLTGRGSMLKTENNNIQILHKPPYSEKYDEQAVLLYDVSAAANLKTLLVNKDQNILGKIVIPDAPICDGAVYVNGDSMYPLLKSGDIIAYKETINFDHLVYGEMYLISFDLDGDEFLTVKYIKKSNDPEFITLVSYNPHHEPMDIPKLAIRALAIVKFSIRKNTMK
ncbi:MAG: S24 family peptidase [Parabacteroides sp.]|nr:S24 family peptidase [Parabacteroides sp.]